MAYSSGFNPHPRISYAGAAPTGAASEAEYVEIALAQVVDAAEIHRLLDEALPPGLDVMEVVESPGGSLGDRLEASRWQLDLGETGRLPEAVAAFLAAQEVLVERMTKKGRRSFDARSAVLELGFDDEGRVVALVRHSEPMVRPDDVASALVTVGDLTLVGTPVFTRLEQGRLDEATGTITDPLGP